MTEATVQTALENYDLRAEAPEARLASVRFAFEFPRLLQDFRQADEIANKAKRTSRQMGYLSIALVLAALLIASSAPVRHALHVDHQTTLVLGYLSAGLGLVGGALAFLGMHSSSPRRVWLHHRLKTEMMRLFHFHYMAARLPELARAKDDADKRAGYLAGRDEAYSALLSGPLADSEAELARIAAGKAAHDFTAVSPASLTGEEDPNALADAFAAWRALRLSWQLGYAEAKLSHTANARGLSSRQTEHAFSVFAWTCVVAILALHLVQIGVGSDSAHHVWIEVAVIWAALVALAARALEDGLQPQRDVERYEQYRAKTTVALERFDAADGIVARLEVVRGFERTSLEEMRVFLRTHARSRFML
jgi:hypothetical protein